MFQDEMHQYYTDAGRHWHPLSEIFTGAYSLLTILKAGGRMVGGTTYCECFPLSGFRSVTVFHLYVLNHSARQHMQIIDTPYLHRLLRICEMTICRLKLGMTYPMVMDSLELNHQKIAYKHTGSGYRSFDEIHTRT